MAMPVQFPFSDLLMPTSPEQKNCVVDCRISSTKQQTGGGLEDQEHICNNFVASRHWNNLKTFSKVYSGRAEERGDFEEILEFIRESNRAGKKVHYYVVKSIDRFTRDGAVTFDEMRGRLTHLGVELMDAWGIIQPEQNTLEHLGFSYSWSKRSVTASAQLMEAERAKDEVGIILSRMVGAEIQLVKDGYKVRAANDGFKNEKIMVDGKKKVIEVPDPNRAKYFRAMYEFRIQGLDDKEIVTRINAMGYKTKVRNRWDKSKTKIIATRGGEPLTVKQFQRIIQRTIYAGIKIEKWTHNLPIRAKYEGLVSVEQFNLANRGKIFIRENVDGSLQLLHNHSPYGKVSTKRLRDNPDYRYKFFPCPICHKPMLGSRSRGKSGAYFYAYHCGKVSYGLRNHAYVRFPKEQYENAISEYLNSLETDQSFLDSFELVLNDVYLTREKEIVSQSSDISFNVGDLKAQQASALDTLTTTSSPVARKKMEERIEELEVKIKEAETQREEIELTEKDIKTFIKCVRAIMEHPSEVLMTVDDMRVQRILFGLVFEDLPTYPEILNGTPKLSLAFKLSENYLDTKSQYVTLQRIEL